jgi:hypothetical protein
VAFGERLARRAERLVEHDVAVFGRALPSRVGEDVDAAQHLVAGLD